MLIYFIPIDIFLVGGCIFLSVWYDTDEVLKKCSYRDVFSQKTVYHKQGTFSMPKCKIASIYAAFGGILALSFHVFLYQFVVTDFCPRLLGKIDNSRVLRLLIVNLFLFFRPIFADV